MGTAKGRVINGKQSVKGDKSLANNYKASTETNLGRRWLETKVGSKEYVLHLTGMKAGLRWAIKLDWHWVKTWLPATS